MRAFEGLTINCKKTYFLSEEVAEVFALLSSLSVLCEFQNCVSFRMDITPGKVEIRFAITAEVGE